MRTLESMLLVMSGVIEEERRGMMPKMAPWIKPTTERAIPAMVVCYKRRLRVYNKWVGLKEEELNGGRRFGVCCLGLRPFILLISCASSRRPPTLVFTKGLAASDVVELTVAIVPLISV